MMFFPGVEDLPPDVQIWRTNERPPTSRTFIHDPAIPDLYDKPPATFPKTARKSRRSLYDPTQLSIRMILS